MFRTSLRTVRTALGSKAFANAPAREQAVSTAFKVQDPKDFNDRVKNSKVPVIVDFFATYVKVILSNDFQNVSNAI